MNTTTDDLRARNLRTLAVLAGLFLLPLLIAFWMYYGTGWRPPGRVNNGELIVPVRPLPAVHLPVIELAAGNAEADEPEKTGQQLRSKWSLVYVGNGACDEACRQALYVMRQTRLSLNNDMTRVERVFLVTGDCCAREMLAREFAGLVVLDAVGPDGARLLREFPSQSRENAVFIVDPLGNLMMRYDAQQNPKGLLKDLQKLLRLSHIG